MFDSVIMTSIIKMTYKFIVMYVHYTQRLVPKFYIILVTTKSIKGNEFEALLTTPLILERKSK